ncbi:odorant receptor 30a-like [Trichogramma pretiosum]|uniref:odorant receptor 30a-like n=1 Tax=Trichogramma pretiosum TaxID=7493 RepID=UPI0006C96D8D|nr:odorant receptor 30a-like [Trichogramma pretiosum]
MAMQFLFIGSYPSQRIYTSSLDIYNKCYSTEWYKYSVKTRKLLQVMMMRALTPSCVKIGPTHPLNFESSGKVVRLSFSYITALISMMNLN